jgi:hypothetical protein
MLKPHSRTRSSLPPDSPGFPRRSARAARPSGGSRSSTIESSAAVGSIISRNMIRPCHAVGPLSKIRSSSDWTNARSFFSGGASAGDAEQRRIFFQRPACDVAQHFGVKRLLVAKMVIDGGDVRARAAANLPHRRIAESRIPANTSPAASKSWRRVSAWLAVPAGGFIFIFKQIIQTNV